MVETRPDTPLRRRSNEVVDKFAKAQTSRNRWGRSITVSPPPPAAIEPPEYSSSSEDEGEDEDDTDPNMIRERLWQSVRERRQSVSATDPAVVAKLKEAMSDSAKVNELRKIARSMYPPSIAEKWVKRLIERADFEMGAAVELAIRDRIVFERERQIRDATSTSRDPAPQPTLKRPASRVRARSRPNTPHQPRPPNLK